MYAKIEKRQQVNHTNVVGPGSSVADDISDSNCRLEVNIQFREIVPNIYMNYYCKQIKIYINKIMY